MVSTIVKGIRTTKFCFVEQSDKVKIPQNNLPWPNNVRPEIGTTYSVG